MSKQKHYLPADAYLAKEHQKHPLWLKFKEWAAANGVKLDIIQYTDWRIFFDCFAAGAIAGAIEALKASTLQFQNVLKGANDGSGNQVSSEEVKASPRAGKSRRRAR